MCRPELTVEDINIAVQKLQKEVARRLNEKGKGSFASRHEILGVITEEYHELIEAVESSTSKSLAVVEDELFDLAAGAVISAACIMAGKVDW